MEQPKQSVSVTEPPMQEARAPTGTMPGEHRAGVRVADVSALLLIGDGAHKNAMLHYLGNISSALELENTCFLHVSVKQYQVRASMGYDTMKLKRFRSDKVFLQPQ